MSRRGRILLALGVVLALAGAVGAVIQAGLLGEEATAWAPVERRDLVTGVGITGILEAIDPVSVGAPLVQGMWNFRIAFLIPEGSTVRAGQPVVAFDGSELERRLAERKAAQASAQEEIEKRRTDLEANREQTELTLAEARAKKRRAELELQAPEDLVAAKELAKIRLDLALAEREIAFLTDKLAALERQTAAEIRGLTRSRDGAAARVRQIEEAIGRLRVPAPRGGIVVHVTDWDGKKKKVGDAAFRGNPLIQIPDLSRLRAAGDVDEADAGALAVGQTVRFRLDSHPDREVTGKVTAIGRTVSTSSPSEPIKVIRLQIALDASDPERMRPGMRFRGEVETGRAAATLVVPSSSVRLTGSGPVVFRRGLFGRAEAVRPELGRDNGQWIEVRAGLAEGDAVLLVAPESAE